MDDLTSHVVSIAQSVLQYHASFFYLVSNQTICSTFVLLFKGPILSLCWPNPAFASRSSLVFLVAVGRFTFLGYSSMAFLAGVS